ncbi:MAG: Na+/H+ antiporter NhaA [Bacteroidetes bacterium]|nr:MAG: Na+/H+ antiporter NhaA [Bacteroidota bacterium]
MKDARSIGILLLACTFLSLIIANSPWAAYYQNFWHWDVFGGTVHFLPHSIEHWVNDAGMAVFFFLAGMEIKRELTTGELSTREQATLPIGAALGGMIVPALLYSLLNKGTDFRNGWGVPMATDIAFSLGIASLLGKKVPVSLKIFLTALAIVDDLGAIIVIAFFYGAAVNMLWLLLTLVVAALIYFINKKITTFGWVQIVLGIVLWVCMFNSGVHATVAGVVFAFLLPQAWLNPLEHKLHLPVYFAIMPVFALANTAITLQADAVSALGSSLSTGIFAGLVIGKPLGISLFCYFLLKYKWAKLPANTSFQQIIGAGMLAGIGFTMSIFIATLAFSDVQVQQTAKLAVLIASLISMAIGYIWLQNISTRSHNKSLA